MDAKDERVVSSDEAKNELYRSLALTRSKICKRNVVSHEVSAGKLGGEALHCLLQPLTFDFWDKELLLPFKIDSTCFLPMQPVTAEEHFIDHCSSCI